MTVINVQRFGSEALELTCKTPDGRVANVLLYRHDESHLEVVEHGRRDRRRRRTAPPHRPRSRRLALALP